MNTWRCSKCGEEKSLSYFYKQRRGWCIECHRISARQQVASGYFRRRRALVTLAPKKCAKCGRTLPTDNFIVHSNGRSRNCRECIAVCQNENALKSKLFIESRSKQNAPRVRKTHIELIATDMIHNCRRRAAVMNLEFGISRDEIAGLLKDFCDRNYHHLEKGHPFRPSLDRIDNSLGYTVENLRVVWLIENLARNRFSEEQLVEFCQRKLGLYL